LQKLHQNEVILLHVKRRNRVFVARSRVKNSSKNLLENSTCECYTKRLQRQTRKLRRESVHVAPVCVILFRFFLCMLFLVLSAGRVKCNDRNEWHHIRRNGSTSTVTRMGF